MTSETFRTYRLQLVIFFSFLALFSSIVVGIIFYAYSSNSEILLKTSDELLYQISESVIGKTLNHLGPARRISFLLKKMVERGSLFIENPSLIEGMTLECLEVYPQFSAVYLGDENGNFVMSKRKKDGALMTKVISRTGYPRGTFEYERNLYGEIIGSNSSFLIDYDPRERPWFKLAKEKEEGVWSREYRLFTDKVPGITCAHPVFDDSGVVEGVVGVDFKLGELSEFLRGLKIGDSGVACIIDSEGNIIAYPERSFMLHQDINTPRSPMALKMKSGWVKSALEQFAETRETRFTFRFGISKYIAAFRPFPLKFGREWILGIIVPEDDFIGPLIQSHETTLLFSFWLLILGGFLTSALAKELTEPINALTAEAEKIRQLEFEGEVDIRSPVAELKLMGDAMGSMKKALKAFKKYVPSEIVFRLFRSGEEARLEAQYEEISLMFTDICNFTAIAESVSPNELMEQMSAYFDEISAVIHKHDGIIDKYIGDSVMAFWGAPDKNPDKAQHSCFAALEFCEAIDELNQKWEKEGKEKFITRVGINMGLSLVGNFGSSDRINFTAMGDMVNVASRIESLNKIYGTKIIISEALYDKVKKSFYARPLGVVAVKGREKTIKVFELLGAKKKKNQRFEKLTDTFSEALNLYFERKFTASLDQFNQILSEFPADEPAKVYIERCTKLIETPPDDLWDGTFKQEIK